MTASPLQVFVGIAVFVVINARARACGTPARARASTRCCCRSSSGWSSTSASSGSCSWSAARTVEDYAIDVPSAIFFVFLFSVLITLYDRYRPVYDFRFSGAAG